MDQANFPGDGAAASRDLELARKLQSDRRLPEAAYRYRAVLHQDGNCFEAALGLGAVLLQLGKPDEAIAPLERATELDGNSAEALASLGLASERLLRWDDAVSAYERSLALRPTDQRTLMNLGGVLYRLDRRVELIDWIEKAIAAEPDTAMLYGTLAGQLLGFGRIDEAVRAMERMLALEPKSGLAYGFLAEMKQFVTGDPHLAGLEDLASQGASLSTEEHCAVRFALGKAYADLGRNDESFQEYLEANRLRRRTIVYDISHSLSEFERLKSIFTPQLMRAGRGQGDPSDRPVFIVGMMRSGTTLVEQILTAHSRVHGCGEMPNFRAATAHVVPGFPQEVPRLGSGDLRRVGEHYLQLAALSARDAARITDKTLTNDHYVGLIHLSLPNARFINVVRDPIDTCLSIFATNFGTAYPYACDLTELGRFCRAERQLMAHWRDLLPEEVFLEVRYEGLVADIESETRRMLEFCGLAWEPACLAFDTSARAVWTASSAQVRRPLYASSVGRWRPAPELLKPLLDGLGEYTAPARFGFTG